MTVKISITPSGHSYDADPAQTVLQPALDAGFILPYGCRNGACGTCKGRILSGDFDLGDFQDKALTAEDRARGYALFCCAKPRTDLTIVCREVGSLRDIPIRTLPCRVQKIEPKLDYYRAKAPYFRGKKGKGNFLNISYICPAAWIATSTSLPGVSPERMGRNAEWPARSKPG